MSNTTDKFMRLLGKEIKKLETEVSTLRADRADTLKLLQWVSRELQGLLNHTTLPDRVADDMRYLETAVRDTINVTIADDI